MISRRFGAVSPRQQAGKALVQRGQDSTPMDGQRQQVGAGHLLMAENPIGKWRAHFSDG